MRRTVKRHEVRVPAEGTKIYKCFRAVVDAYPKTINTSDVARTGELNNKETSALMISLMTRGLIIRVSSRKGLVGGSIWTVSDETIEILDLKTRQRSAADALNNWS